MSMFHHLYSKARESWMVPRVGEHHRQPSRSINLVQLAALRFETGVIGGLHNFISRALRNDRKVAVAFEAEIDAVLARGQDPHEADFLHVPTMQKGFRHLLAQIS